MTSIIASTCPAHPSCGSTRDEGCHARVARTSQLRTTRQGPLLRHWTAIVILIAGMQLIGMHRLDAAASAGDPAGPGPSSVHPAMADRTITIAVEHALLFGDDVFPYEVEVRTQQGIVTLSGTVENLLNQDRVAAIAGSIRGVRGVIGLVTVAPEPRTDDAIRMDVQDVLRHDPATESYKVQVSVQQALVILTGTVGSYAERLLAERIVKGIRGVIGIRDGIAVGYLGQRKGMEIAGDIRDRLQWDIWLDGDRISVAMMDGAAILTGSVACVRDTRRAFEDAWVDGVRSVDVSGLRIDPWERDDARRVMINAPTSDHDIGQAILAAWHLDPRTSGFHLAVTVEDGEASISGEVGNLRARISAAQDAQNTVGVASVANRVRVKPVAHLSDTEVATRLTAALATDPLLRHVNIVVSVKSGVAALIGSVDSSYQRSEAMDIASRTTGVVTIHDDLALAQDDASRHADLMPIDDGVLSLPSYDSAPTLSDTQIKRTIEDRLSLSPDVDRSGITVAVTDGVATLSGTAGSWIGRREAVLDARQSHATAVVDHLDLKRGIWRSP